MFTASDMFATGRCRYPSKFCPNARARKRNGELHRFCEEHRAKANDNQKRWSSTRQRQWDAMEYHAAVAAAAAQGAVVVDPRVYAAPYHPYPHARGEPMPVSAGGPHDGTLPDPELMPQSVYLHEAPKSPAPAPVASSRPQTITRTPSQVDRYLTHLLFRSQSSSVDMDEHESATTPTEASTRS